VLDVLGIRKLQFLIKKRKKISAVFVIKTLDPDPDSLNPDPECGSGSSILRESGSGSRVLMTETAEIFFLFLIKNCNFLIPRTSNTSKNEIY